MTNLLSSLKNRLQVLTLKKDLKAAQAQAKASTPISAAVMLTGGKCIDGISESGNFNGGNWEAINGMKYAAAAITQAGGTLSSMPTAGISDPSKDYWSKIKKGESLKTASGPEMKTSVMAAYNELAAIREKSQSVDTMVSKPEAKPSASSAPPKPAATSSAPTIAKPVAAIPTKPVSAAGIPVSVSFGKKPDFSNLKGVERVSASMKWAASREAHFLAEAEKIVAAEEAAAKAPKTATAPTAENIARAILDEQAERAKPKPSAWSRESTARRDRVKKLAAELAAKDPQ